MTSMTVRERLGRGGGAVAGSRLLVSDRDIRAELGIEADLTGVAFHERVAAECEARVQGAATQDERERWQWLAHEHWGRT